MIALEIRSISSPDAELPAWEPQTSSDVLLFVELEIGEVAQEGSDIFQVLVATPDGLVSSPMGPVLAERATLVIREYSWSLVRECLERIVGRCAAETWNESVLRLQRYFHWEYEDYQTETPVSRDRTRG